jgi:DNA-binding SARP family transcriptional activator
MYSLACVLYETLAGDLPLRSDTLQILRRLQQPLPSIRDIRPGVPGTIDRALRRALAPDRSERFTTMAEFVGALRQVTRFDILALGTPSVRAEGRTMAEASLTADALACLALLARAGDRGLARGHVITLLWEDKADREGERLLEEILSEIAQAFGSPDAIAGVERLRLNPVLADSDIARFDAALASGRLADAAALYRGPFLDGFELQSSPFTRWARHTGAELAFEFSAVVERLAREAERRSEYKEAVRWWRRLVAQDPLNGRLALELMRALVAAGDRDAAIQHARIHEALIEEEIALPLDQAVVDLAASLEAGRPKAGTG